MQYHHIKIDHQDIAYAEKNPDAIPLIFFVHGNSSSHRVWMKQLADSRLSDYRMISLDLPGHGNSSGSSDPFNDYTVSAFGSAISKTVKKIAAEKPFVLVGSSFGTNCVAETLAYDLHPAGIVLIGSSVFGGDIQLSSFLNPETDMSILFSDEGEGDQLHAFISKACFFSDKEDIRILIDDYYKVANPFRSTLIQTMMAGKHANEIDLLQKAKIPTLFLFGEKDNIVDIHYLDKVDLPLWNNRIIIFPEAGHLAALDRPDEFNELLLEFMKDLF